MDEHTDRPVHSPPPTKPLRTNLGWFVVCIVAIGAALLVAVRFDDDSTDTTANHAVATERGDTNDGVRPLTDTRANPYTGIAPGDNRTQLDVRGIPTWWSHEAAVPQHNDTTELDEHGIPTWWSHGAAAPREV